MKKIVAFNGDKSLKELLVEEIKKHREADEIAQGSYGNGEGPWCAVGFSIHSLNVRLGKHLKTNDHSVYETELGIPRILARLEDRIFEGLKSEVAKDFPLRFIEAIPVGADLSLVWAELAVWLLTDEKYGVLQYTKRELTRKAIKDVADLYTKVINGESVDIDMWRSARQAAAAAAAAAAYAAAYAAAAYAAAYAADAYAAAYAADRSLWFEKCAEKLIEILSHTLPTQL